MRSGTCMNIASAACMSRLSSSFVVPSTGACSGEARPHCGAGDARRADGAQRRLRHPGPDAAGGVNVWGRPWRVGLAIAWGQFTVHPNMCVSSGHCAGHWRGVGRGGRGAAAFREHCAGRGAAGCGARGRGCGGEGSGGLFTVAHGSCMALQRCGWGLFETCSSWSSS